MKKGLFFLLFSIFFVAVLALRFDDEGDSCSSSSSSSSSSDSDENGGGHHHGGGGHHHGGGGHHPPVTQPPTQPVNNANRPKCPKDWFTSYRPQGIWCIRIGRGTMDYQGAIAQCATYGGVLSGVQTPWERWLVAQEATRQTLLHNIQIGGVWLGAQRNPRDNIFYWTDGHTVGTEGIKWGPGQPDNAVGHGPQNCLQILAISPGYWNNPGKWSAYRTGDFDDYWCNMKDPEMRLYACGMRGPRE